MTWIVDDIPLSTLAFNVSNRAAAWRMPAKRGDNLVIPGRSGSQWIANKPFEEGSISLSMWAVGATEDGLMPEHGNRRRQARDNLDKLTALFAQTAKLLEVVQVSGSAFGALNTAKNPAFEAISVDSYYTYQNSILNPAMRRKAATTQFSNLFANPLMQSPQLLSGSPQWWPNFENIVKDPYNKLGRTASPPIFMTNYWAPTSFENYDSGDTIGSNWTVASNTTGTVQNNTAADQTANPLGGTKVFRVLATAALGSNAALGTRPGMAFPDAAQPHLRFRFRRSQNTSTARTFQIRMVFQNAAGTTTNAHPWKTFSIPNGSTTWADAIYTRDDFNSPTDAVTAPLDRLRVEFRTGQAWSSADGLILDCFVMCQLNYTSGPFNAVAGPFWDGDSPWGVGWNGTAGTSVSRWYAKTDTRWVPDTPTLISNAYYAFAEFPGTDSTGTTCGFTAMGVQSGGTHSFNYTTAAPTNGVPYTLKFNWRGRSGTTTKVGLYKQGTGDDDPVLVGEHTLVGTATPIGTGTRMNGTFAYVLGPTYTAQSGDVLTIRVTVPVRTDGHHAFQFSNLYLTDAGLLFSGDSGSTSNSVFEWAGTTYDSKSIFRQRRVKRIANTEQALISTVIVDAGGATTTVAEAVCRANGRAAEIIGENIAIPSDHKGLWLSADAAAGNLTDAPSTNPTVQLIAEVLDGGGSVLTTKSTPSTTLIFYISPTPVQWTNLSVSFLPEEIPVGATHVRMTVRQSGSIFRYQSFFTSRWMIKPSTIDPTWAGAPAYFDGTTSGASWNGTAHDSTSKYQIQYPTAWGTTGVPATSTGLLAIAVPGTTPTEVAFTTSMSGTHSAMQYLLAFEAIAMQNDDTNTTLTDAAGVAVRAEFLSAGGAVVTAVDCGTLSGNLGAATYETFQGTVEVSAIFTQLRLVFTGPNVRNALRAQLGRVYLYPNSSSYTCPVQRIDFNGVHNPGFNRSTEGWTVSGTSSIVDGTKGKALRLTSVSSVARSSLLAASAGSEVHLYLWGRQSGSDALQPEVRYCKVVARNLLANPSYAKASQPWFANRSNFARAGSPTTIAGASRYYQRITFAASTSVTVQQSPIISAYNLPVTAGQTYYFGAYTRASKSVTGIRARMYWYTAEGTFISTTEGSATTINTSWGEVFGVHTAPATAMFARPYLESPSGNSWAISDTWDVSCARVVQGQTSQTSYWEGGDAESGTVWSLVEPTGTHLQVEYTAVTLPTITQTTYVGGYAPPMLTVPATYTHVAVAFRGNGGEVAHAYLGNDFPTHETEGYYDPQLFAYMDGSSGTDVYQQPTYWQGSATDNGISRTAPNMPEQWIFTGSSNGANVHLGSNLAVKPPGSVGKAGWVPRILKGATRSYRTIGVARGANTFLSGELSAAMYGGVTCTVNVYGANTDTASGTLLYSEEIAHPSGTAMWLDLPITQPFYYVQVDYAEAYNGSGYRLRFDNLLLMPSEVEVGAAEYPGYFDGNTNGASWIGLPNQSNSQYYGGGRRAFAEVKDAIDMTSQAGGTRAEFGVEMIIPSSFWEDLLESTMVVTADVDTGGIAYTSRVLDAFLGTTAPIDDAIITIAKTGTISDLKLTDVATGAWVQIDDALPATTVIDNADFTVMSGATSLIARVTRGGSNQLLPITTLSSTEAPRLGITATGTGSLTITIVCRRKYAIA